MRFQWAAGAAQISDSATSELVFVLRVGERVSLEFFFGKTTSMTCDPPLNRGNSQEGLLQGIGGLI